MSWDDDHCPVTEMLRATCVHCRPPDQRRRFAEVEADLVKAGAVRTREVAPDRSFEDGPVTVARYDGGECPACRCTIRPGEHIRLHNGRWCHINCL